MRVLFRKRGEPKWRRPVVTANGQEGDLQKLIGESPELLMVTERPQAVAEKFPVPPNLEADLVGVDPDGNITVVECKLDAAGTVRRRAAIGQVFVYAAGIAGMSYEEFDQRFQQSAGAPLAQRVAELVAGEWDEEAFRKRVADNLAAGRFRLVVAVDMITDEVKGAVRYINQHTDDDVQFLAVELRRFADEEIEVVVPETYGQEASEIKARAADVEPDLSEMLRGSCSPDGYEAAQRLIEWAKERGGVLKRGRGPSLTATVRMRTGRQEVSLLTFYQGSEDGNPRGMVSVNFEYLRPYASDAMLKRLADQLRAIRAFAEHRDVRKLELVQFNKQPEVKIEEFLVPETYYQVVIGALDELLAGLTGQSAAEAARSYGDQSDQT